MARHALDTAPRSDPPSRAATRAGTISDIVYAGDRPTVRVVGRVDRDVTNQVSGWIRGLLAAGVHHLVVDVSGARDCDASMLTVLSRARAQLADAGDSFTVVGLQLPEFLEVLPHASLDEVFVVYDAVRRGARP
jgi:anti-anti-sigma regulatory factor